MSILPDGTQPPWAGIFRRIEVTQVHEPENDAVEDSDEPAELRRAFGWRARAELDVARGPAPRSSPASGSDTGGPPPPGRSERSPVEDAAITWREGRGRTLLLIGGVILAGLALVALLRSLLPESEMIDLDLELAGRVALLPIGNGTGDQAYDWVEVGLTTMVAETLGRTTGVFVVAPERLRRELGLRGLDIGNRGLRDRLHQIAFAAGADLVVEAELRPGSASERGAARGVAGLAGGGGPVRWTLAFEISSRQGQVAAGDFTGTDPFTVLDRLVFSIVRGLKTSGEPLTVEKVYSQDLFLDRLYAMGLQALQLEGPESARPFFEIILANKPYFLQARLALADCERRLGNQGRARELVYAALEEAEARADRPLRIAALRTLGLMAAIEGNTDTAAEYYSQALDSMDLTESRSLAAEVLFEEARLALAKGDLELAGEKFEEILQLQRSIGDRLGEVDILMQLSSLRVTQQDLDEADRLLAQALISARELDDRWTEVRALASLGQLHLRRGELEPALENWADALAFYEQRGDRTQQMWLNRRMADTLIRLARLQEAEDRLHQVVALAAELDNKSAEAAATLRLAWVLLRSGYPFQAKPHLDRTLELDRWLNEDRSYLQRVIAWFAYEQGNYRLAVRTQEELKQLKPEIWRPLDEEFLQVFRRALAAGERLPVPGEREYRASVGTQ